MSKKTKSRKDATTGPEDDRPRLVRDSFTMPEHDYTRIGSLKERCLQLKVPVKKGELLRAGLRALEALDDQSLLQLLEQIERLKTGRPRKGGKI